jgi:hypothetical protein
MFHVEHFDGFTKSQQKLWRVILGRNLNPEPERIEVYQTPFFLREYFFYKLNSRHQTFAAPF